MRRAGSSRLPEPPRRQAGFTCEDPSEVARVLEATIERNGENGLAAEQQALPGALDAQLEEIAVRRHAHGGGEQMREMIRGKARDRRHGREPEIIRQMRVDEIDGAAQASVESHRAPLLVEARHGKARDKPRQKRDGQTVDVCRGKLVLPGQRRRHGVDKRRDAGVAGIERVLQDDRRRSLA